MWQHENSKYDALWNASTIFFKLVCLCIGKCLYDSVFHLSYLTNEKRVSWRKKLIIVIFVNINLQVTAKFSKIKSDSDVIKHPNMLMDDIQWFKQPRKNVYGYEFLPWSRIRRSRLRPTARTFWPWPRRRSARWRSWSWFMISLISAMFSITAGVGWTRMKIRVLLYLFVAKLTLIV